jgi:hypothetical protein
MGASGHGFDHHFRPAIQESSARPRILLSAALLAFQGGSADIDGSTIYHDSGAGAWRKFHNDDSDARQVYAGLTAGLAECALVEK